MARPVGEEDNNKIPKAISRPEGGWFAKIWDERKSGQKKNDKTWPIRSFYGLDISLQDRR